MKRFANQAFLTKPQSNLPRIGKFLLNTCGKHPANRVKNGGNWQFNCSIQGLQALSQVDNRALFGLFE